MRRWFLLVLGVALWACPAKVNYPECRTDGDCAPHGQVCAAGSCRECRDDSTCPAGRPLCKDAICVAKSECPCATGLKCAADKCVPECSPATAVADCGDGRQCVQGRCAAEELCDTDAQCGDGRACVNQRCLAQGEMLASRASRLVGECEVRAIFFGFDDATLTPEARKTLEENWDCAQKSNPRRVVLAGHTDERGTTEYNLALGMRRADVVKRYLSGLGVDAKKLRAVSFGKERPLDRGHDEGAFSKNRRVEFVPEVGP